MGHTHQSQYSAKVAKKALRNEVKERGIPTGGFNHLIHTKNNKIRLTELNSFTQRSHNPNLVRFLYGKRSMDNEGRLETPKKYHEPTTRRNPGRMDGVQWNGNSFVPPKMVDDGDFRHGDEDTVGEVISALDHEDVKEKYPEYFSHNGRVHSVSLLDIAKPAKVKGVAKEFEVVAGPQRVITIEDYEDYLETFSQGTSAWDEAFDEFDEESEWDDVYEDDEHVRARKTYSAILRGG
ncbi:hypothetical protein BDN72DRAFT_220172 [Pluteus cervinus]|uniref:Uncharacterized protein n=1 Tax=Pluteus cervinus TaxID=181527 RepID=A0ACD3AHM7_9AGAR|nr:hypothetical protein BDN72DRAFT_220172 [Pluteus cervinus]